MAASHATLSTGRYQLDVSLVLSLAPSDLDGRTRSFDPFMAVNGLLGGLVAITASSPMVETEGSFVIGCLSGVLVFYGSGLLLKMKV